MTTNSLKQALLKNKYLLVKRILQTKGHGANGADYRALDESDSLEAIEAKLTASTPNRDESRDSWLKQWLKR